MLFSSLTIPIFPFGRYSSKGQILKAIERVRYPRGGTRIGKASGVEVFAIGLGKKVKHRQLRLIATDRNHVMTTSFSTLMTLILKLKNQICRKLGEWNVLSS